MNRPLFAGRTLDTPSLGPILDRMRDDNARVDREEADARRRALNEETYLRALRNWCDREKV